MKIKDIRKILTIPLSHCIQLYDILVPAYKDTKMSEACVVQRADGKFYRGQRGWQWCNSVHEAAFLKEEFIEGALVWKFEKEGIKFDIIRAGELYV